MEIPCSKHKHIIIKGGSGKTIVAAAILGKISDSLKNDEKTISHLLRLKK